MYHVLYHNKYLPPGSVHTHDHRVPRFVWTICVNYCQHVVTAARAHHSGADRHIINILKLRVSNDSALRFDASTTVAWIICICVTIVSTLSRQHTRTTVARIIIVCIAIASARRSGSTHIVWCDTHHHRVDLLQTRKLSTSARPHGSTRASQ